MIDSLKEDLITLAEASALMPNHPNKSTLYNYTTKGVRGVVLETFMSGPKRCTSKQALQRFYEALSAPEKRAEARANTPYYRSRAKQQKAARKAAEKLKKERC